MTLTDFLLARIAEDEAVARATLDSYDPLDWGDSTEDFDAWRMQGPVDGPFGYGALVVDPKRVLAECEAKRQIVERRRLYADAVEDADLCVRNELDGVLRAHALPYAEHPSFDPAWRP